jgi:hypothetical protein
MTVRTGWTWGDAVIQAVVVGLFPVAVLLLIVLPVPRPPADAVPRLVAIVIFLAGLDLLFEEITSPRQVRVGPGGVTFRFLFHSESRGWSELEPDRMVPRYGGWGVISRYRGGRRVRQRGFALTIEQARALLGHPNCPKWELSAETRIALGLAPNPG